MNDSGNDFLGLQRFALAAAKPFLQGIAFFSCFWCQKPLSCVDANGYGGAFEDSQPDLSAPGEMDFWNRVQDAVDEWIIGGGLRSDDGEEVSV